MIEFRPLIAILAILVFCGFLIAAMVGDVRKFRITNKLNFGFAASFFVFALLLGMDAKLILGHVAIGAIAFFVCFVLFFVNLIGGGDVKLVGATALWLGGAPMYNYVMLSAVLGGLVGILLIAARFGAKKIGLPKKPIWLRGILRRKAHMPYGVALGLGGILAMPLADWAKLSGLFH